MIKIELISFKIFFGALLQNKTYFPPQSAFSSFFDGEIRYFWKLRFFVTDKCRWILHSPLDLTAFDLSYDGIWTNLTQNEMKLIRSTTLRGFFSPLTSSSKVKAKISKAVQKSQVKCTSQQSSYLFLSENKVKDAGIVLGWTWTSVFKSPFSALFT